MSDSGTPAPAPASTPGSAAAPGQPPPSNRRLAERKVLRGTAQIQFAGHPPMSVRTFDVSISGMAVIAPHNPNPSAQCVMQFAVVLKNGRVPVQVSARVVHSVFSSSESGFKVGLQFLNPSSAVLATLKHYIEG